MGECLYLTMALVRGENLAARIKVDTLQKRLSNRREMAEIVMKIAQALTQFSFIIGPIFFSALFRFISTLITISFEL